MNNIKVGLMAAALAAFAGTATAGDFPKGSVDYVIPFGPGGESDITARLQQPYFEKFLHEALVRATANNWLFPINRAAVAPSDGPS